MKEDTKDTKLLLITALNNKKLFLQKKFDHGLPFIIHRDQLVCMFIMLATIITAVFFVSSPSYLFLKWYSLGAIIMFLFRIIDYSQKKGHFYLIDFCYTAGIQILYFLMFNSESFNLTIRAFGFGAGVLGWSTFLFSNCLTVYRLDEFCGLWIHTVPSFLAYSLRWMDEKSLIYYKSYKFEFGSDHMRNYYKECYLPYFIWAVSYYLIISKIFQHWTVKGDYMTLVRYMQNDALLAKPFNIFGPNYHVEAFIMWHFVFFSVTTFIGYVSFFCKPLHTFCLIFWVMSLVANGAKAIVKDLTKPYKISLERINFLLDGLK